MRVRRPRFIPAELHPKPAEATHIGTLACENTIICNNTVVYRQVPQTDEVAEAAHTVDKPS